MFSRSVGVKSVVASRRQDRPAFASKSFLLASPLTVRLDTKLCITAASPPPHEVAAGVQVQVQAQMTLTPIGRTYGTYRDFSGHIGTTGPCRLRRIRLYDGRFSQRPHPLGVNGAAPRQSGGANSTNESSRARFLMDCAFALQCRLFHFLLQKAVNATFNNFSCRID